MQIPTQKIRKTLFDKLRNEVLQLKKHNITPSLTTVLIGSAPEQLSFVNIKKKTAEKLDVGFTFIHLQGEVNRNELTQTIKKTMDDPSVNGIIIQLPLPDYLNEDDVYTSIPLEKDIEGHSQGSVLHFPLSLAALSALKFCITKDPESILDFQSDKEDLYQFLKDKKIVIAGRGKTGGEPVANMMDYLRVPYLQVSSETKNPQDYYKVADIIVTAVGRKIIEPEMLKKGVILINVGLRKENGSLKGDYDEQEIDSIASYYTKTPGGTGPLDVLYLYYNLIQATKMQNDLL